MQTSTFGLKFDSLRYDVPLKIRSRSSKHKKNTLQTIPMICPNNHLLVHKISCIHTRKGVGEWYANTSSLTGSAQKYVPPPLEWGEIKRVVYVWRQTKPNVAASKNGRKGGNKTEFCYHWVQCLTKCWSTFSLLCSKLLRILFTHTCIWYHDLCPHFL